MKIKVTQVDWSGWNGASSTEKELEYDIKLKKEVIVKSIRFTTAKKSLFKHSSQLEKVFAFKVLEIGESYVVLETNGYAGGEYNEDKKKYLPKISVLKLGDILIFSTKTTDAGSTFYISIDK